MKAVILAAGKGSRLFPVTHHIPKPLLPLANRPTMEYAFDRLKEIGVREICVVVGENEPAMRKALGNGEAFGLSLGFVRQPEPKGLAHAVGFAKDFVGKDDFILYLGDGIYSEPIASHAERFSQSGCANLNVVQVVPDPERYGIANTEGERIVKLVEKPKQPESNLAMAGIYFFGNAIWEVLPDLLPSARGEYEITDAIQCLIDRGETVLAGTYKGAWFDTGTLDSFLATSRFLAGNSLLAGDRAEIVGDVGEHVVVGSDAFVRCASIEDSVILPGARVEVDGVVRHALVGGNIKTEKIDNQVAWDGERG